MGELPRLPYRQYPGDVVGPAAVTEGVVNLGGMQAQHLQHLPHIRQIVDLDFTISEASQALALLSGVQSFDLGARPCNYLVAAGSVRGNDLYVSMGATQVKWVLKGATYYPLADYIVKTGAGSVLFRVPTRTNWSCAVVVLPPSGYSAPYADAARLVFGYLPDELEYVYQEYVE